MSPECLNLSNDPNSTIYPFYLPKEKSWFEVQLNTITSMYLTSFKDAIYHNMKLEILNYTQISGPYTENH
jgi:hypothetical protein